MVHGKTVTKKANTLFWFQVKISRFLTTFTILGFSNHAQRFSPPYYLDVGNPKQILNRLYRENRRNFYTKLLVIIGALDQHFKIYIYYAS